MSERIFGPHHQIRSTSFCSHLRLKGSVEPAERTMAFYVSLNPFEWPSPVIDIAFFSKEKAFVSDTNASKFPPSPTTTLSPGYLLSTLDTFAIYCA